MATSHTPAPQPVPEPMPDPGPASPHPQIDDPDYIDPGVDSGPDIDAPRRKP